MNIKAAMSFLRNVTLCIPQDFISGLQVVRRFHFGYNSLAFVFIIKYTPVGIILWGHLGG